MERVIECAFCDGKAYLKAEQKERVFRKETFITFEHYYKCESCQEEFTTTETDNSNVSQILNQYREKHNILFPEQISALREKYNLPAAKMGRILGFGANVYGNYEKGEIPSVSHARYLSLITEPEEFRKLVVAARDQLHEGDYKRITGHIDKLISKKDAPWDECDYLWKKNIIPNQYTGYALPSFVKFANMAAILLDAAPFKVKLNKLLFYSDFLNFKLNGRSISGSQYQAIQLGPVPFRYDWNFDLLLQNNYIRAVPVEIKNEIVDKFVCVKTPDTDLFSSEELQTIKIVKEKLGGLSTKEVVNMSHNESGWIEENELQNKISYQKYGYSLKMGNL
ncbi:MAG TPA: type II toxin-antitoxin system antitoxin SocA domain-containing protein [Ignavibacteriales bacterium]|nr:type II toxin-antitoxin system antitoxin SocA domain-containing protein [Ignavibacteriales bacterium]